MRKKKDHYETLGVSKDAPKEEIKKVFRKKISKVHPDKPGGNQEEAAEVINAYMVLSDPVKREKYDKGEDPHSTLTPQDRAMEMITAMFISILDANSEDTLIHTDIYKTMNNFMV